MNESAPERGAAVRAIALWIIVAAGLVYGVVNTTSQVANLFGA
jgi:hypothetical protein